MPKEKWPQWRLTFRVNGEGVLRFQPVYAGSPAAAVERALGSLESMAGRREARRIRANLTSIEVERI